MYQAAIGSSPRKLSELSWLCAISAFSILLSGTTAMIGAGLHPNAVGSNGIRNINITASNGFNEAFGAVLNPTFAFAGHFIFFTLMSEMRNPRDAWKAVSVLSFVTITYYLTFSIVTYYYLGDDVKSPSFDSLTFRWKQISYGCGLASFLISSCLSAHVAAKQIFVRYWRNSRHLHSNSIKSWGIWGIIVLVINSIGFILAVAIPIFNLIIGLVASLFASVCATSPFLLPYRLRLT